MTASLASSFLAAPHPRAFRSHITGGVMLPTWTAPSGRIISCNVAHPSRTSVFAHVAGASSGPPACRDSANTTFPSQGSSPEQQHLASVSQAPLPASLVTPAKSLANSSSSSIAASSLLAGTLGSAAYLALRNALSPSAIRPMIPLGPPSGIVPRATSAAPAALAAMAATFPRAMQEEAFLRAVAAELSKLGFKRTNSIALVNTCRDEVCRPIVSLIDRQFGLSFNLSGLGGLVNCGTTGFKAAMSHSPEFHEPDGSVRERYIFFAFPHVSIGESGEVGSLLRRGRGRPSSACGALIAIQSDLNEGKGSKEDPFDEEYVLLKRKVSSKVTNGGPPLSLVQVTRAALATINEDLEKLISLTVDPATADYAVVTGVQIHSGNQIPGEPFRIERTCDYISPDLMYAVVRGQRYNLKLQANKSRLAAESLAASI
ncbi:hypothetical protein CLOP_g15114 [Closterium sp. NIES-67]|nr:hypothetical protein CLOP_g15114 [Closterium sp. NIES-67]